VDKLPKLADSPVELMGPLASGEGVARRWSTPSAGGVLGELFTGDDCRWSRPELHFILPTFDMTN